jgi:hypothetical protein
MAIKEGEAEAGPESALDAINEALGVTDAVEGGEETELEDDTEGDGADADEEGEEPAEGDDEGDGADDEEGEGEETEEEKAAKAAGIADGTRNPDGTFKKTEAKKPDPINDPIPKDLKPATSERMRALVKIAKEKEAEVAQVRGDFDTIINGIKASGSTPEQYGEAISWLSLFNSPKVEDRRAAYELVENVADRMATLLGIDRAVQDPLVGHADLIAAVKANPATMPMAKEIARTRNAAKFTGDIQQGQQRQQQTADQARQEHEQAKTDLNAFDAEMRGKDPLYDAKRKLIVPILQPLFKTIPKSQWAQAYRDAYAQARVKPKNPGAVGGKQTKGQPLRGGKNPAGGQSRAATSALDAMNGAIASLGK